jgi:hypothetical protein
VRDVSCDPSARSVTHRRHSMTDDDCAYIGECVAAFLEEHGLAGAPT